MTVMLSDTKTGSGAAPMAAREPDGAELLLDLARAVLRRWHVVLSALLGTVVAVYLAFQILPDVYEVEARLLVKIGRENLHIPAMETQGSLVLTGVRKEDINSDVALLGSQFLVERAVDDVGVDAFVFRKPPPVTLFQKLKRFVSDTVAAVADAVEEGLIRLNIVKRLTLREKIVRGVKDQLFVSREGDSDVIRVALRLPSADLGVTVLASLVSDFLTLRAPARADSTPDDFIGEQVRRYSGQLESVEAQIRDLREKGDLTSIAEERRLLLERKSAIESELDAAVRTRASIAGLPFADKAAPAGAAEDDKWGGAPFRQVHERIGQLLIERAALIDELTPSGRAVVDLERKIGNLVRLLDRSLDTTTAALRDESGRIERRLGELTDGEAALQALDRRRTFLVNRLGDFTRRQDEAHYARLLQKRRIANVSVLNPPTAPAEPRGPRRLMMSLASVPLGLVLGVVLAGTLAYLDRRIYGRADLDRIPGLTVLGEVRPGR